MKSLLSFSRPSRRMVAVTTSAVAAALLGFVAPGLVQAAAVILPAASPDVSAECTLGSYRIDHCSFIDTQFNVNEGPWSKVSDPVDNCTASAGQSHVFEGSISAALLLNTEKGDTGTPGAAEYYARQVLSRARAFSSDIEISGSSETFTRTYRVTETVPPGTRGWIMWAPKRLDVAGYYDAWYRDKLDGHYNWYYPFLKGSAVHIYYPAFEKSGPLAGRLWLQTEECSSGGLAG